jgi:hypothetical protein
MKTTDGAFIWQPGLVAGQPASLLGYPVIEAEDMPDVAANSLSIAFGNFKAGYIITERAETSILRDPYSKKPYVYFYATLLLDGLVQASSMGPPSNQPPEAPVLGRSYLCGPAPTGAWLGHGHALASWTEGGWRFTPPVEGLKVVSLPDGLDWQFLSGQWTLGINRAAEVRVNGKTVLGPRAGPIPSPAGGANVDAEARVALNAILAVLRGHGLIER